MSIVGQCYDYIHWRSGVGVEGEGDGQIGIWEICERERTTVRHFIYLFI